MNDFQISMEQAGVILLLTVFWGGGLYNLLNWDTARKYLISKGFVNNSSFVLLCAILWQFTGAALAMFPAIAKYGYLLLILFTLFSSFFFYQFWRMQGVERHANFIFFLSNVGVIGGLLLIYSRFHGFYLPWI